MLSRVSQVIKHAVLAAVVKVIHVIGPVLIASQVFFKVSDDVEVSEDCLGDGGKGGS